MRALGIDLASDPRKTGVCVVAWCDGTAIVEELRVGAGDKDLLGAHERCDVTGIDAPFGWPLPFVELMADGNRKLTKPWSSETRNELRYRLTDFRVHELTGRWPLSVSTDLIGVPALRCAGLLTRMGVTDRSGDGRLYESYPAAALKVWGLKSTGYKGPKKGSVLNALWSSLKKQAPWLQTYSPRALQLLTTRDDAFDALVTALIARAAAIGLTAMPTEEERQLASSEGWIHVPLGGSLCRLVGPNLAPPVGPPPGFS